MIEVLKQIKAIDYDNDNADLGDVGSLIGEIIAKHISDKDGFGKEDFLDGLEHGFELKETEK